MNKATTEAYLLANLHVLRLCVEGIPSHLEFPTVNQLFFDRCLSAVSKGCRERKVCEDAQLQQSIDLYKSWRPIEYEPADTSYLSSGWMSATAKMMAVNTNNALRQNFIPRFQRYLRLEYRWTKTEARDVVNRIIADTYDGSGGSNVILEYREEIPRPFSLTLEKPHLLIPLMFTFLKSFEAHHPVDVTNENADPEIVKLLRLYTLLPHKSGFGLSYYKINSTGLRGLLLRAKDPNRTADGVPSQPVWGADDGRVANEHWRQLFNFSAFETENRKFAGEISTDDKGVSILMKRNAVPSGLTSHQHASPSVGSRDSADEERWGLDPGRKDLFVATNQSGERARCSSKQFYEDARYTESNKKMKVWLEKSHRVHDMIRNMPSMKTIQLHAVGSYVKFLIPRLDCLFGFYSAMRFRNLRFKRHVFRAKKLHGICSQLTAVSKANIIVGFGDWSNNDAEGLIKRSPSGPVQGLKRQLRRYCRVVDIDEYLTSQIHSNPFCHQRLTNQVSLMRLKDGSVRNKRVYSVLHCKFSGCGMTVNRNANASENMLLLLEAQLESRGRPAVFSR
ncbi:hypothetical protein BBJ28_00026929 [Nothophytophthora sp. Chile5]|nr:hypothetical protein BBJ28_00026929 [Nothophytophthora sp. Chile5]